MDIGYTLPYELGVRYRMYYNSYKYDDVSDSFNVNRICTYLRVITSPPQKK